MHYTLDGRFGCIAVLQAFERDLRNAYQTALAKANESIMALAKGSSFRQGASFLQQSGDKFRVEVSLAEAPRLDAAARDMIFAMENKRTMLEKEMVAQVCIAILFFIKGSCCSCEGLF